MGTITTADLIAVQDSINQTTRFEIGQLREHVDAQLGDLKSTQRTHDGRLEDLDGRLRATARGAAHGVLASLSAKQKAGMTSAAAAAAIAVVLDLWRGAGELLTFLRALAHP